MLSKITETKTIVAIGFSTVVILMTTLLFIGVRMIEATQSRLDRIVHINNLKIELITEMRTTARERTICLNKMLVLNDPFARDEEWMRLNELGNRYVEARNALLELPLSQQEEKLLREQNRLTAVVAPSQHDVAQMITNGQRNGAVELLLNQTLPGQDQVFSILSELIQYQKDNARTAAREARTEFNKTLIQMLSLAAGFILVTIFIARFVQRQAMDSERRLFNAKEHAQVTLHSIGEGVICTNLQGEVEEINDAATSLIGCKNHDTLGRPITEVMPLSPEGEPGRALNPVDRVIRQRGLVTSDGNAILQRADGDELAVEFTASPIYDRDQNLLGTILVFRDVSQMRALSNQLSYHARHDGLTGLVNRREFEQQVSQSLELAQQQDVESWLCFIDMDQFKIINDTCGHLAGDELLKRVATTLCAHIRDQDTVARLGGDEFAILIRNASQEGAYHMVERIREEVQNLPFAWDDKHFTTSTSIGLTPINREAGNLYELLSTADSACYLAKDGGRNRIHLHQPDDTAMAQRHGEMQWVHHINRALEENRFTLHFQAITPLQPQQQQRCGEILVRMVDTEGKLVPPMAFIPAAERYNLMAQIDRWVIRNTVETLSHLGRYTEQDNWVSINLSAQSLCDDHFLEFVEALLEKYRIPASMLCFEITETDAIANISRALDIMSGLKSRGCLFALDDFGSGVSSFGYLKNLPVDVVKIDGTFVRDLAHNEINYALVEAINRVGHVMGIRTIAEYVENRETILCLRRLGVDYGQGYGIHRPMELGKALAADTPELGALA